MVKERSLEKMEVGTARFSIQPLACSFQIKGNNRSANRYVYVFVVDSLLHRHIAD